MATRGERFKAQMQREAHRKKASAQSAAAPREEVRPRVRVTHNEAARAAKNSSYELEGSGTARPSRKSTRRSPTHVKTDSGLRITAMNRIATPQARSERRGGKTT